MRVILSYPMVTIEGAPNWLDSIGRYKLKLRKDAEEIRKEKERRKAYGKSVKINPFRFEEKSVMERDPDDPTKLYFFPGLWPKVKEHLDVQHVSYEIVDRRDPAKKPQMDLNAVASMSFRPGQDQALALIATADCGIIEASVGWGKSVLISMICRAFPTLKILVCTDSTQVVQTLYGYLLQQIPGEVGILMGGKDTTKGKRVIVSTMKSVSKIPPEEPDLICCDECHCCGDNQAGQDMARFCFARRFGFSATPYRNDGSKIVMEALFGPTMLKVDYDTAVDAGMVTPMKYVMLPCNWCPEFLHNVETPSDVLLKRYSYWSNKARNNAIKTLLYEIKERADVQILIMVATLQHAIELHLLMPWLVVAYYGNADMDDLRKKFPKSKYPNLDLNKYKMSQKQLDITRNAFAKGTLKWVVSTFVFRQGVNFPHLRVLVRADGTTSAIAGIQIPGRLSRLDEGKDCAYLVDFNDTFTDWAVRRSQARAKLYSEQGWKEITREELLNDLGTKPDEQSGDASGAPTATA